MDEEILDESFFLDGSDDNKKTESVEFKTEETELKKTGLENSFNERQVGSIAKTIEPVSGFNSLDEIVEMFKTDPNLHAVPIEENGSVIGVVERKVIENATNTALKRFVSKTCADYVTRIPITIGARDFMEKIMGKLNEAAKQYDVQHFVVLVNNRSFYGVVSLREMGAKIEQLRAHDLEKAALIQQHMLPNDDSTKDFPFYVGIWNKMANPVGGDFYIAQRLTQTSFVIASFDVSGKNVSAALLTVTIGSYFATLKQLVHSDISAVRIASMLDSYLQTIVPVGNFITGALCYIDAAKNQIEVLNCGHTNVFALKKNASNEIQVATLEPTLPPFGMGAVADALKSTGKAGYRLPLKNGVQLDLYSDGFTDMQDDEGTRYDEENSKKFFKSLYDKDISEMGDFTERTVTTWIQHSMLPDDITVLNIRF